WVGVRVLRYSIGFGPRIGGFTSRRSGVEYRIGVLHLGGYVKILDERQGTVADDDQQYAFNRVHPLRRIAILAAGPAVNVIFALVAYWGVFMLGTTGVQPIVGPPPANSPAAVAGLQAEDWVVSVNNAPVQTWRSLKLRLFEAQVASRPAV